MLAALHVCESPYYLLQWQDQGKGDTLVDIDVGGSGGKHVNGGKGK